MVIWIFLVDRTGWHPVGAAVSGVYVESEVLAAKLVTEEMNVPIIDESSRSQRERESPEEGMQVVRARITKSDMWSPGAERDFLTRKEARNNGQKRERRAGVGVGVGGGAVKN